MDLKKILAKNYINAIGWRTNRRLVVIESDDWGSIRMPSREVYNKMLSQGIKVDQSYFDKYDSLESTDDLAALFEILCSVKDRNGHCVVITPLSVCANPDFEKIEEYKREKYVYELVTDTYKRHKKTEQSYKLIKQGMEEGLYCPQFHGREHLHVRRWLESINSESTSEQLFYKNRCLLRGGKCLPIQKTYFPAFGYDSQEELYGLMSILKEGLILFESIYGAKATSFCPPCGIAHDQVMEAAAQWGIVGLQAGQHFIPQADGSLKIVQKKWGAKSASGQIYWRRNCTFEPSRNQNLDWVDSCLAEMKIAFRWGKPAVINSHRVNYIGSIFPENRDKTLKQFGRLLKEIVKRWPDVEFINSAQLCKLLWES